MDVTLIIKFSIDLCDWTHHETLKTFLGISTVGCWIYTCSKVASMTTKKVGQQLHPTPIQIQCAPGFTLRTKDGDEYNRSNIVCKARRVVPEGLKCAKSE